MRGRAAAVALVVGLVMAAGALVPASHAAFPGANGFVYFERLVDGTRGEVWRAQADGSIPHHVVEGRSPSVSGDGSSLAFERRSGNDFHVLIADADGSNAFSLGVGRNPAISRNGSRVAFTQPDEFADDGPAGAPLWVMNADGTGRTQLTSFRGGYSDLPTSWSPDGTRILFDRRFRGGSGGCSTGIELMVINADGTGEQPLGGGDWTAGGDWSPDGTKIAYTDFSDFGDPNAAFQCGEVWVMDADGTNRTRLTVVGTSDWSPRWSPQGDRIAFRRGPSQTQSDIYVMSPDGSNQRRLIADGFGPHWAPAAAPTATPTPAPTATPAPTPQPDSPVVEVSPAAVGAGERLRVSGRGFEAGESLRIELHSQPRLLATTQADQQGRFDIQVTVPRDVTPGSHTILVVGSQGTTVRTANAQVHVTPPLPDTSPDTSNPARPLLVAVAIGMLAAAVLARARVTP